jgi:hypothetical protein
MIAWITFGPIMDDARFDSPKSPKNCSILSFLDAFYIASTYHVVEARWR